MGKSNGARKSPQIVKNSPKNGQKSGNRKKKPVHSKFPKFSDELSVAPATENSAPTDPDFVISCGQVQGSSLNLDDLLIEDPTSPGLNFSEDVSSSPSDLKVTRLGSDSIESFDDVEKNSEEEVSSQKAPSVPGVGDPKLVNDKDFSLSHVSDSSDAMDGLLPRTSLEVDMYLRKTIESQVKDAIAKTLGDQMELLQAVNDAPVAARASKVSNLVDFLGDVGGCAAPVVAGDGADCMTAGVNVLEGTRVSTELGVYPSTLRALFRLCKDNFTLNEDLLTRSIKVDLGVDPVSAFCAPVAAKSAFEDSGVLSPSHSLTALNISTEGLNSLPRITPDLISDSLGDLIFPKTCVSGVDSLSFLKGLNVLKELEKVSLIGSKDGNLNSLDSLEIGSLAEHLRSILKNLANNFEGGVDTLGGNNNNITHALLKQKIVVKWNLVNNSGVVETSVLPEDHVSSTSGTLARPDNGGGIHAKNPIIVGQRSRTADSGLLEQLTCPGDALDFNEAGGAHKGTTVGSFAPINQEDNVEDTILLRRMEDAAKNVKFKDNSLGGSSGKATVEDLDDIRAEAEKEDGERMKAKDKNNNVGEKPGTKESLSDQHTNGHGKNFAPHSNKKFVGPFNKLFEGNRNPDVGLPLTFIDKNKEDLIIDISAESTIDDSTRCLVGHFSDNFPGKDVLLNICKTWKVHYSVIPHPSSWIIFKFGSVDDACKVLNGGPYNAFGRTLLLKRISRTFQFKNEDISILPIWVQLRDLPMDFYCAPILSKIRSMIGKPLYADKMTRCRERLAYARALVEIDVADQLPKVLEIKLSTGDVLQQHVFYENVPLYCSFCKKFGHLPAVCGNGNDSFPLKPKTHPPGKGLKVDVGGSKTKMDPIPTTGGIRGNPWNGKKTAFGPENDQDVDKVRIDAEVKKGKKISVNDINKDADWIPVSKKKGAKKASPVEKVVVESVKSKVNSFSTLENLNIEDFGSLPSNLELGETSSGLPTIDKKRGKSRVSKATKVRFKVKAKTPFSLTDPEAPLVGVLANSAHSLKDALVHDPAVIYSVIDKLGLPPDSRSGPVGGTFGGAVSGPFASGPFVTPGVPIVAAESGLLLDISVDRDPPPADPGIPDSPKEGLFEDIRTKEIVVALSGLDSNGIWVKTRRKRSKSIPPSAHSPRVFGDKGIGIDEGAAFPGVGEDCGVDDSLPSSLRLSQQVKKKLAMLGLVVPCNKTLLRCAPSSTPSQ